MPFAASIAKGGVFDLAQRLLPLQYDQQVSLTVAMPCHSVNCFLLGFTKKRGAVVIIKVGASLGIAVTNQLPIRSTGTY